MNSQLNPLNKNFRYKKHPLYILFLIGVIVGFYITICNDIFSIGIEIGQALAK